QQLIRLVAERLALVLSLTGDYRPRGGRRTA
ncbi:MAG: hypothetical protein XU13_C0119G0001, partial [Candidatus Rokubacteria bacterium CSP1-6]